MALTAGSQGGIRLWKGIAVTAAIPIYGSLGAAVGEQIAGSSGLYTAVVAVTYFEATATNLTLATDTPGVTITLELPANTGWDRAGIPIIESILGEGIDVTSSAALSSIIIYVIRYKKLKRIVA